jgi:hypothetical protein
MKKILIKRNSALHAVEVGKRYNEERETEIETETETERERVFNG